MKLTNELFKRVIVSLETLGNDTRLCDVRPYYEYIDGNKTDKILGYAYVIICPGLLYSKVDVKIPGSQLLTSDSYGHIVQFANMHVSIYPTYSRETHSITAVNLRATADDVTDIDG